MRTLSTGLGPSLLGALLVINACAEAEGYGPDPILGTGGTAAGSGSFPGTGGRQASGGSIGAGGFGGAGGFSSGGASGVGGSFDTGGTDAGAEADGSLPDGGEDPDGAPLDDGGTDASEDAGAGGAGSGGTSSGGASSGGASSGGASSGGASSGGASSGGASSGGASSGGASSGGASSGGASSGGASSGGASSGGASSGGASSGGASSGGASSGGAGAGGASPVSRPPCITNAAQQVALIGDSYITGFFTPPLQPELVKLVPAASAYPNYAGAGCSLASGGICTGPFGNVPQQLTTALSQHPNLRLVIMNGGGNDVLIPDTFRFPGAANGACVTTGSSTRVACQQIVQTAVDAARNLMIQNADAGVKDVIYFFYPHLPPDAVGTLAGPNPNEILDYAVVRAQAVCAEAVALTSGNLRCHFVNLVPPFEGRQAQLIAVDHVHPTLAGQGVIADAIRDVMVDQCLGQPASSGCCAP